jgi:phosphoribosylcarboxyaminoimidazole (NCAIR) mutase
MRKQSSKLGVLIFLAIFVILGFSYYIGKPKECETFKELVVEFTVSFIDAHRNPNNHREFDLSSYRKLGLP